MSQQARSIGPTPRARQRAEAEAIYQLLRVLDEERQAAIRRQQEAVLDTTTVVVGDLLADGKWHQVVKHSS
jgi:hypothetical protein